VSASTVFGKFVSDCKDSIILAKRAKQLIGNKEFPGEKIRLKRDFKSKFQAVNFNSKSSKQSCWIWMKLSFTVKNGRREENMTMS
jgi:hypothetical protein